MFNRRRYLNFLTNKLPIILDDISLDMQKHMFFEQNGAPVHNATDVKQHLNQMFSNRWTSIHGVVLGQHDSQI